MIFHNLSCYDCHLFIKELIIIIIVVIIISCRPFIRPRKYFSSASYLLPPIVPRPMTELRQQLSHYCPAPGCFRAPSFSFSRWCPSECDFGDPILSHAKDVAKPSEASTLDLENNAVAACLPIEFQVGYFIRPEYLADLS